VARVEGDRPHILKNPEGSPTTPSVIYFPSKGRPPVVGAEAKSMQEAGEADIASFFKRHMGTQFLVEYHAQAYSAVDLSAIVLRHLMRETVGASSESAVITTPAYFDNNMRQDTLDAGQKAGIDVLGIINEPTAAAIAFGMDRARGEKTVMVYDLGGGTFDVTIVFISPDEIKVLGCDGDHQLGGKDWDDRLVRLVAEKFQDEYDYNPLDDRLAGLDLTVRCETAKLQLSTRQKGRVPVTHQGCRGSYEIGREEFEAVTRDLVARTIFLSEKALKDVNRDWSSIDEIVPVGGSTRMPMVLNALKERFKGTFATGVNPDEAVALGAAIEAVRRTANSSGKKTFLGSKMKVTDVTAHSLGMVAENRDRTAFINCIILPKNQPIPSALVRTFQQRTRRRGDNFTEVYILQGESENPLECSMLGKYTISGIEPEDSGIARIDIGYHYDVDGVVKIEATQQSTRKSLPVKVDRVPEDLSWLRKAPTDMDVTAPEHLSVFLAVDLSGSMSGTPLEEAKRAAKKFVQCLDLTSSSVGLHIFADSNMTVTDLTQSAKALELGIDSWSIGQVGFGNDSHPFDELYRKLHHVEGPRFMVVLTDGAWSCQPAAIESAARLKAEGVQVIVLGFGGADHAFITRLANTSEDALLTSERDLATQFGRIAQVITEGQAAGLSARSGQQGLRIFK